MIAEEAIRAIVVRLARPSGSRTGTHVVERAASLAEGPEEAAGIEPARPERTRAVRR